jgi:hypothetical protein
MDETEPTKTRRLRLPFIEIEIERIESPSALDDPDADATASDEDRATRSGLSADWHATLPLVGLVLLAFAAADRDWLLAVVALGAIALGLGFMWPRLGHRTVKGKIVWTIADIGVTLVGLALALALQGTSWWWAPVVVFVLLAPVIANALAPEEHS